MEKNKGGGFYVIRGQDLAGAQSAPLGGGLETCLPQDFYINGTLRLLLVASER